MHGRGSTTRTANLTHLPVVPFQVAAQLYQLAGDNSKAAELYLKAGCVDEACAIMGQEQHPELLLSLAQALEGALPLQSLNTSHRVFGGKSMVEISCFAQATLADLSSSTMNLVQ